MTRQRSRRQPKRLKPRNADEAKQLTRHAVQQLETMAEERERELAAHRLLAEVRKRPTTRRGAEAQMIRFRDALVALTMEQWMEIAQRAARNRRKVKAAAEVVASVLADFVSGNLLGPGKHRPRLNAALRAQEPLVPILRALPESATYAGKTLAVRKYAAAAVQGALQVLMVYEWLATTEDGAAAAKLLAAPFDGLASLP
jgi:hypothetical protein